MSPTYTKYSLVYIDLDVLDFAIICSIRLKLLSYIDIYVKNIYRRRRM